jgi:hypothetical protein
VWGGTGLRADKNFPSLPSFLRCRPVFTKLALDLWDVSSQSSALMIKPETKALHDEMEKRAGYLWRYL